MKARERGPRRKGESRAVHQHREGAQGGGASSSPPAAAAPRAPVAGSASPYPPAAAVAPARLVAAAVWETFARATWPGLEEQGLEFPWSQVPPDLRAELVAWCRAAADRLAVEGRRGR